MNNQYEPPKTIEFTGYLTGQAKTGFVKKVNRMGRSIILFAAAFLTPVMFAMWAYTKLWIILPVYCCGIAASLLFTIIPKPKKELNALLPKQIYIQDECITCIADSYTETKYIQDVKEVLDHGEFYELNFPFGKVSEKFICQKSLLSLGTLEDFEELFSGKIKRL